MDSGNKQLAELGAGGQRDRLSFDLVAAILFRCLPLLNEAGARHLFILLGLTVFVFTSLVYPGFQLLDLFWTRVLAGEPITTQQIAFLGLDATAVADWNPEVRKLVLRRVILVSVGVAIYATLAFTALYYYRVWYLQRINQLLRLQLLDRLQALSLRFHSDNSVGDSIYRMYQDSGMVTQLIEVLFVRPTLDGVRLVFSLVVLFLYKPLFAGIALVAWPVALVIGYLFSRPMRVDFRRARESNSALTGYIQESLSGIRVIKAYRAEKAELSRFETRSRDAFECAYGARNRFAVYKMLIFWAFAVCALGTSAWAAMLTTHQDPLYATGVLALFGFTVWNLGLYNNFKARMGESTAMSVSLFNTWGFVQDIAIGLDRVFELLDLEPEVKDEDDAIKMPAFESSIAFRGVSFAYQEDRPVLQNVDIEARASTISAIVGPTGSGKSTLMTLLLRLYDPTAGRVEIDGRDIRRFKVSSLRDNVAIALQENILFGTSIRENIRYARPAASDAQVREAARVAGADDFIEALADGYDTVLGERGAKLSTGQRQRVSIARAILKDTPILILDEPTAALDAETELRVMDNLAQWGNGRAVFIITHRLSTIRRADQVAFISEGELLECDSHDALMTVEGGAYRKLVDTEEAAARAAVA